MTGPSCLCREAVDGARAATEQEELHMPEAPRETTFYFEAPDHRGRMIGRRFAGKSEGVARYKFRRWMLAEHGVRAHPSRIVLVGGANVG
jgi:hypothetical protein